jgi:hypothetical protein
MLLVGRIETQTTEFNNVDEVTGNFDLDSSDRSHFEKFNLIQNKYISVITIVISSWSIYV